MISLRTILALTGGPLLLAACQSGEAGGAPGDTSDSRPYAGISQDATIHLIGTEPFWNGTVADGTFTYATPENIDGDRIAVERFAGRGGVSYSGTHRGAPVDLMITPGRCSDQMSERTYPFTATLQIDGETRLGCAWREGDDTGEP
ncbi:COG3650 family protein [Aurantiacibacter spongiae]|uniref:Lipoprotein n=1 Tax=Aurantiacibacter spongiae TaxID=2488860 RepID=A0A3N5DSJ2_9SPHN|nr:hypothetical protein [Aurantiacibacter spongiae]RPF72201.1 hypothetical protein EG799_11650 [Aurantiacibacter spongiae]